MQRELEMTTDGIENAKTYERRKKNTNEIEFQADENSGANVTFPNAFFSFAC